MHHKNNVVTGDESRKNLRRIKSDGFKNNKTHTSIIQWIHIGLCIFPPWAEALQNMINSSKCYQGKSSTAQQPDSEFRWVQGTGSLWFPEVPPNRERGSPITKWQTCSAQSLHPPPPPARKATSYRSGTPPHTCVSRIRDRGGSSPCSPHPDSRTCPCCWTAVGLCCRTLCSWLPSSVCMQEMTDGYYWVLLGSLVFLKHFLPLWVFFNYSPSFV